MSHSDESDFREPAERRAFQLTEERMAAVRMAMTRAANDAGNQAHAAESA